MDNFKQDLDNWITREPEPNLYEEAYERYIDEVKPQGRFDLLIKKVLELRKDQEANTSFAIDCIYEEILEHLENSMYPGAANRILEERYGIK